MDWTRQKTHNVIKIKRQSTDRRVIKIVDMFFSSNGNGEARESIRGSFFTFRSIFFSHFEMDDGLFKFDYLMMMRNVIFDSKMFFSLSSFFVPSSFSFGVFCVCYKPFYQAGTLDNDVTCDGCIIGHMHRRLDVSVLEPNTCIDVKWRECNFHLIACVLVVAVVVVVVHRLLRASVLCRLRRRKKKSHITKFTCHEYNYDDDR